MAAPETTETHTIRDQVIQEVSGLVLLFLYCSGDVSNMSHAEVKGLVSGLPGYLKPQIRDQGMNS